RSDPRLRPRVARRTRRRGGGRRRGRRRGRVAALRPRAQAWRPPPPRPPTTGASRRRPPPRRDDAAQSGAARAAACRRGEDRGLDERRDARDGGKSYIAGLQTRERQRTGISSLKVGFNKVFGYYIEVTRPNLDQVPADYERRQTLAGAERFVTPELKEYEARVLGAEERIGTREAELMDVLRRRVADAIGRVQHTAQRIAELDVWAALADLAHREAYVRPEVTDGFGIRLEGSRH